MLKLTSTARSELADSRCYTPRNKFLLISCKPNSIMNNNNYSILLLILLMLPQVFTLTVCAHCTADEAGSPKVYFLNRLLGTWRHLQWPLETDGANCHKLDALPYIPQQCQSNEWYTVKKHC